MRVGSESGRRTQKPGVPSIHCMINELLPCTPAEPGAGLGPAEQELTVQQGAQLGLSNELFPCKSVIPSNTNSPRCTLRPRFMLPQSPVEMFTFLGKGNSKLFSLGKTGTS